METGPPSISTETNAAIIQVKLPLTDQQNSPEVLLHPYNCAFKKNKFAPFFEPKSTELIVISYFSFALLLKSHSFISCIYILV